VVVFFYLFNINIMTNEQSAPLENTPGTMPQVTGDLSSLGQLNTLSGAPEQISEERHLSAPQLDLVVKFTRSADAYRTGLEYQRAIEGMRSTSEHTGDDPDLGGVAITAVAIGALSRDPASFSQHKKSLRQSIEQMGFPDRHADVLFDMQGRFFQGSHRPARIAQVLHAGLENLDSRRDTHGENTSAARVAFIASAFAATHDQDLRVALFRDLQGARATPSASGHNDAGSTPPMSREGFI
jgi:hypothetical protein